MILNIRRSTGVVVDINQKWDELTYENRQVPDGTVTARQVQAGVVIDQAGTVTERVRAAGLQPAYVLLMNNQPFGRLHAHPNNQLVVVLSGAIGVAQGANNTPLASGESLIISKNVPHLITGAADNTLILTVQI